MCARAKGSGTLIKRGKYWMAKWIVDGKIYTKSTRCTVKEDALKKLKELTHPFQVESDIEKIENLEARIRNEEHKLSDADDEYACCPIEGSFTKFFTMANSRNVSDSTRDAYLSYLGLFIQYCKDHKLNVKLVKDVDRRVAEKYLSHYKSKVCGQRYNCTLAQFKKVWSEFGKMSKHRCFKDNPWSGFKYQPAEPSYKRELTTEELMRVLSLATDEDINLLFCIGIYTGLRLSDCCSLKWSEVDLIKKTITKVPLKTRRLHNAVVIPIHPVLLNKLLMHRNLLQKKITDGSAYDVDEEYVSYALLKMYRENTVGGRVSRIFKKAKISTYEVVDGKKKTTVSFHSLRHTFVSMAATAGIPLDVVKNLVGHTSTKMTQHYEHISQAAMANAIAQLPCIGQEIKKTVTVEVDENIIKKLSQITSKTIEEVLNEYISANEKSTQQLPVAPEIISAA